MEAREAGVSLPSREVHEMIEPEVVRQVRVLFARGWGAKRIAKELGIARNTVRRYLRDDGGAETQVRPGARALDDDARAEARQMFVGLAEGNAVVVQRELARRGNEASVRTVQRVVEDERRAQVAADVATVRFETPPGKQMQIDFGQKRVMIGGSLVTVHLLVAVLSYSRRIFVRAFLAERGDDWREGIAAAFRHFGGVVRVVLGDNAKALVVKRDRESNTVVFHPTYLAFCRDWDVEPRACAPYRARTKGKTESGVRYVKINALAGRAFDSFHALEQHLSEWMFEADRRVHGTTFERPIDRFERAESVALRALPALPCLPESSGSAAGSRTTRSSTSTPSATAFHTSTCARTSKSRSASARFASTAGATRSSQDTRAHLSRILLSGTPSTTRVCGGSPRARRPRLRSLAA